MSAKQLISIHKLIHWALVSEHAEHVAWLQGSAFLPGHSTGFATSNSIFELGTHVDTSSFTAQVLGARCHDDALEVLDAIYRLDFDAQVVVIKCGRADCHPYFAPEGVGRMVPVLDKRGNPKKMWRDPSNKTGYLGIETKLDGLSREEVKFHRSAYRLWREALVTLHGYLQNELKSFELNKKVPAATPWKIKRKRVLAGDPLKKVS